VSNRKIEVPSANAAISHSSVFGTSDVEILYGVEDTMRKPPVIPVSSEIENSLVPASRVPTPVIPVSVIPIFHIIFHIYIDLIKKSSSRHI
jgi:hypothetical protein